MLFATLDPTSRKLILPSGMAVLLVDLSLIHIDVYKRQG